MEKKVWFKRWFEKLVSAHAMVKMNGWATVFFLALVPVSLWAGWLSSVVYVSVLSLWALVSGHLSAYEAARVEREQLTGSTLNDADREWLEKLVDQKIRQILREEIQGLFAD